MTITTRRETVGSVIYTYQVSTTTTTTATATTTTRYTRKTTGTGASATSVVTSSSTTTSTSRSTTRTTQAPVATPSSSVSAPSPGACPTYGACSSGGTRSGVLVGEGPASAAPQPTAQEPPSERPGSGMSRAVTPAPRDCGPLGIGCVDFRPVVVATVVVLVGGCFALGPCTVGAAAVGVGTGIVTVGTAVISKVAPASQKVGTALTGFTKHGINQPISREGVGVSNAALLDALRNPISVTTDVNGFTTIIGANATVILNAAGKVATMWATSSAGTRLKP